MSKSYFKEPISIKDSLPFFIGHVLGFYGFYLAITNQSHWKTGIFVFATFLISGLSVVVGAHRLFTHRCYEASKSLRLFLLFWFNYSAQYSLYEWVRHHRVHHKFSDTDADPHNSKRGFFFSQIGWLFLERSKEFQEKVKTIDLSDLKSDPAIMFQRKYFQILLALHWTIATLIPCYFWDETLANSACTLCLGFIVLLNQTFIINSVTHCYGWKPYDTQIEPTFYRWATYMTGGEGYHNFHHAFPNDYSASELKWTQNFNINTLIIDVFEYFGMVKNKKVATPALIKERQLRTGDKTIEIRPSWNVVLDYFLGFCVCFTFMWITLGLRYAHAKIFLID